jgi:hypothetical protein
MESRLRAALHSGCVLAPRSSPVAAKQIFAPAGKSSYAPRARRPRLPPARKVRPQPLADSLTPTRRLGRSRVVTTVRGASLAGQTSMIAGSGTAPGPGALAREADHAASAHRPGARVAERSPALLRRVNEVMREGRRGQTEPERIPFFCECRRADCYEPVWLTADAMVDLEPIRCPMCGNRSWIVLRPDMQNGRAPVRPTRS